MHPLQAVRGKLRQRGASALLAALLVAVLLMQTLGLLHRTIHGPRPLAGGHHSAQMVQVVQTAHAAATHGLEALFGGHVAADPDCRVYDQLGHADGLAPLPALLLPPVFSAFVLCSFAGEALARWAALFDARGPPLASLR